MKKSETFLKISDILKIRNFENFEIFRKFRKFRKMIFFFIENHIENRKSNIRKNKKCHIRKNKNIFESFQKF